MREPEDRLTDLFRRHADDLHAYAAWRVGPADAADVVGEVFLVAWRGLERIRTGEERAYLFGVARKLVLVRLRKSAASAALDRRLAAVAIPESGPDEVAEDVARRDHVRRALLALSDRDREVLITAGWFDLSPAEAARVLGVSRPAYLVRLHRARNRFRTAYQRAPQASGEPSVHSPLTV